MASAYNHENLLAALQVFSTATDKASIERANVWLQDFQHSAEAWAICNSLLLSPDAPQPARLFAAQTFRTKVTYDLNQVEEPHIVALRDTLIAALTRYQSGPKVIQTQLCLALAGFALQVSQWEKSVQTLIQDFGRNPSMVPILLEFLTVLPEEVNGNTKIPISNDEYRTRAPLLLTDNAKQVLELLSMYIQAEGVTSEVQSQVFQCLRSWLNAGELLAQDIASTPLFAFVFDSLSSEQLFDSAVDVVCDIIHETQEVYENEDVIQLILPRLVNLRPRIAQANDDPDKMRGFCRVFAEAGETYRQLLLQHPDSFVPLIEAIAECTAYHDLDIVTITFGFWYRLAQSIGKHRNVPPVFLDAYKALVEIIIKHLRFPNDAQDLVGQEADDFRSFRHVIGDTLKDCCYVLGADVCLMRAYEMVVNAIALGNSGSGANISWQEIEAPLFSMRSMGGEVDVRDDEITPRIMDLLPQLPNHPRIRYAAMLVIGRYTEWTNMHPQHIAFQLTYLSSGFEDSDSEVAAAAGQAMKYLCKDCKRHLVPSLPQLYAFYTTAAPKLSQDDRVQVCEAIAHVISYMPMEQAAQSLRTFCLQILASVHTLTSKPNPISKEELKHVADYLEQIEAVLHVVDTFGEELPAACQGTCQEIWNLFNPLLQAYGGTYFITERVTRLLRQGLQFFGAAALPVIPSVIETLSISFTTTGFSNCLWVVGKIVQRYGSSRDSVVQQAIKSSYENMSLKVASLLRDNSPTELPDILEDYIRLQQAIMEYCPDIFFLSPAFVIAFTASLTSLGVVYTDIIFASLDTLRDILTHECLSQKSSSPTSPPKFPLYAEQIRAAFSSHGHQLVGALLTGLVGDFPEEAASSVITLLRAIAQTWPTEFTTFLPAVLDSLPLATCPLAARKQFVTSCNAAVSRKDFDKVKHAVTQLLRDSRRARERRETKLK
ncbi:ARM repeat-containing protein [Sistotremastrum suecicum HHB10207 ss-3]|uniref:ARM repeat-containing protein n=1 Tax=Sistotremastrum suecicum HHB10207 ss-3 TaxID=1314776 RepID=A0A166JB33_9AGAM|nr:ARM repeat-containing protein [Sistotremastrum suecicum HHB10207 ss-3]